LKGADFMKLTLKYKADLTLTQEIEQEKAAIVSNGERIIEKTLAKKEEPKSKPSPSYAEHYDSHADWGNSA